MCMEVAGGRKWAELGVSRKVIRDVIVDIASNLAADLNGVIQKKLVKYEIQKGEVAVQIAGSVRAMELEPDKFLAGDIDIDWYDLKPDNQPFVKGTESLVKDNISMACAGEFRKKKIYEKDFEGYKYKAEKDARNWNQEDGIRFMKIPVKIQEGNKETNVEITAELKNVTSDEWHQGYKKGKRRITEGERDIWLPDKQIYMDICMRLCELKFNSIKVSEEMLEKEVLLAVRNKGLFTKKEIIEARVSKEEITCIAKEKLEDNWYQVFEQVIKCNSEADFVDICKMSR